jgi:hypothetical protein
MSPHPILQPSTSSQDPQLAFSSVSSPFSFSQSLSTTFLPSTPTPINNAGKTTATIIIFRHSVPIWAIAVAAAGLAILISLLILLLFICRRRRRRQRPLLRPISMESFVAGQPESAGPDSPILVITNPRKSRSDRLLHEISLITASSKEDPSSAVSQDFGHDSSSSSAEHSHGTDGSKELDLRTLYYRSPP